jgi:L-seryl-tRNA(Ser) seleniumtransferase
MSDLRRLPKVDALAASPKLAAFHESIRVRAARGAIAELRAEILSGESPDMETAEALAECLARRESAGTLSRTINASGVILHTGLGRARLSAAACAAVAEAAAHHASVEFDLESGKRGDRQDHVRGLLMELTGSADALVVNNCAAAVFLTLSALCSGKGVLLSRGQMVEIGGSFRMPDVVRQSGCRLIEVGCTNKTHLRDFESADNGEVGAILRCHPSNFKMVGFVEEPDTAELAGLCRAKGWLLIDDVGSGTLFDTSEFGLPKEPTLQDSIAAGADVVLSSGDKMIGGPQAGLILGSRAAIGAIRSHPLARALRVDKLTLAALSATLRLAAQGRFEEIPTYWALSRSLTEVKRAAQRLRAAYSGEATVEEGLTEVGGGSIPGAGVRTWRVGLDSANADELAQRLRQGRPAILARIERDRVWLDPRTMDEQDVRDAVRVLKELPWR